MTTTESKLDPKTMATVTQILIEQHLLAKLQGDDSPERNATLDCLVAQLNYWLAKS